MKKTFFGILILSVLSIVSAKATELTPNINAGDYDVSASGAQYSFGNNLPSQFYIIPHVEYFVANRLSLGGAGYVSIYSGTTNWGIGPSVTYHFFQWDHWVGLVGASGTYNLSGTSSDYNFWNASGRVGVEYFVTPSVAMGPVYNYIHNFKNSNNSVADSSSNSIVMNFSVYF